MGRVPTGNSRILNLALQGGGAHGAFTWGVLDRLLEDERIDIEGISGTSAGAMNAAVLAQGFARDGKEGARKALDDFWDRIASYSTFAPIRRSAIDRILASEIDIRAVRACERLKLFVCATNVRSGKIRIFERTQLTIDVLLASACLPHLFRAVEIDGDPYWDGGYMGNPAIFPLINGCVSPDVAIVQINPLARDGVPKTSTEILNRLNEISFNSSLMREMRAIEFINRLLEEESLTPRAASRLKAIHVHMIAGGDEMKDLGTASKFNAEIEFVLHLKSIGRRCAGAWLDANVDDIGVRSTINLDEIFL